MKFIEISKEQHDAFVSQHSLCNLLQSSSWAKVKENWDHRIMGVYDGDVLMASASILIKSLPFKYTMMYIPRGPIMDYENQKTVQFFMNELKKWAKQYHCLFIKMDPAIQKNTYCLEEKTGSVLPSTKKIMNILRNTGCRHLGYTLGFDETIQPRFHAVVERCDDFENTLPKHTKRHIKTARKKQIRVDTFGVDGVTEFAKLMRLTEERKNISLRDESYFRHVMDVFGENAIIFLAKIDLDALYKESNERLIKVDKDIEKCKDVESGKYTNLLQTRKSIVKDMEDVNVFVKEDGNQPYVAAALCVFFGNTCEMLYMGMDDKYKRFMGPYLSHLTPMLYSFEHGYEHCNMGGLEGTLDGGLTKFKANFNPVVYEYVGEFEFATSPLYPIASKALKLRKKLR